MSRAAKSVLVYGVYLLGLGLTLIVAPNLLLPRFGFLPTREVWVRVAGMLILCLAFYYVQSGRRGFPEFFQWTVHARVFASLCLFGFSLLRLAGPALAFFGLVDLAGAIWTSWALRHAKSGTRGLP